MTNNGDRLNQKSLGFRTKKYKGKSKRKNDMQGKWLSAIFTEVTFKSLPRQYTLYIVHKQKLL